MFSEDFLKKVKSSSRLSEVLAERISLKKSGRGFIALCPFHSEKTASFHISDEKEFFYCFGCKKTGDVFTYLKEKEGFSFVEAVKYLCEKFGITLESHLDEFSQGLEVEIARLNRFAAEYWHANLVKYTKPSQFLRSRGITEEIEQAFKLGYAEDGWETLISLCRNKGFSDEAVAQSGLFVSGSGGRSYERFRDRIIIPFFDVRNKLIGFGGRALADSTAKYINTPETSHYKKGEHLFGLNLSKDAISSKKFAILTEGYFDFISLWQNGIHNAVATLGTAFTAKQAELLKRFTTNCIVCFDGDAAGNAAAEKASSVLVNSGFSVKVMILPTGEDADSLVRRDGATGFTSLRAKSLSLVDFKLKSIKNKYDFTKVTEKVKAIEDVGILLKQIESLIVRREYFDYACVAFGIDKSIREGIWQNLHSKEPKINKEIAPRKNDKLYPSESLLMQYAAYNDKVLRNIKDLLAGFSETANCDLLRMVENLEELLEKNESEALSDFQSYIIQAETMSEEPTEEQILDCVKSIRRLEIEKRLSALAEEIAASSFDESVDNLLQKQLGLISLLKTLG